MTPQRVTLISPGAVERIDEWHLSPTDDAAIADLLARTFTTDFGGRSFFVHHHHQRLVMREDGRIIGHMALVLRSVQLGEERVTIAGLAEVATDPAHRGKGIAAALLRTAVSAAATSPAQFLLLFGDAKVYAAAGFKACANRIAHVVTKGDRVGRVLGQADEDLMVLPLRDRAWPEDATLDLRGPKF